MEEFRIRRGGAGCVLAAVLVLIAIPSCTVLLGPYRPQSGSALAVELFIGGLLVAWALAAVEYLRPGYLRLDATGFEVRRGISRLRVPWWAVTSVERAILPEGESGTLIRESEVGTADFRRMVGSRRPRVGLLITFRSRRDVELRGWYRLGFLLSRTHTVEPAAFNDPATVFASLERHWAALRTEQPTPPRDAKAEAREKWLIIGGFAFISVALGLLLIWKWVVG